MKAPRIVLAFILSCCAVASAASGALAAPADTDRSFGQEGVVRFDAIVGAYTTTNDMVIGSDSSIYVLRTSQRCVMVSCTTSRLVTRLRPNGGPDSSFGVGGTSNAFGGLADPSPSFNASLALGADGRVVAAWTEGGALILRRLNADGSLDAGFAGTGRLQFDFGTPIDRARVAVQADGRIVVAAEPLSGYGGDAVVVARFTPQGTLDPAFHGGQPVFTSLGSGFGGFSLTGAGRVLLAGPRCCAAEGRAVHVARFDAAGAFDGAFGRQGEVFVDDVTGGPGVGALVVLPNGRIYVVGSGRLKGDVFVLRLRRNGRVDRSYGRRGTAHIRHSFLRVAGAAVDRAGRLLVFGSAPTGTSRGRNFGSQRITVLRRLFDGRPDQSFAGGGLVSLGARQSTTTVAGGLQRGRSLIVLAHSGSCIRTCPSPENFLVRFIGGSAVPRCAGHRATIVGTRRSERLVGTRRADVIVSLAGDDTVLGRGGHDLICGGSGSDHLVGGPGRDVLKGGAGRNTVTQ